MTLKLLGALFALLSAAAQAATGLTELAGLDGDGPVTVFYPSSSEPQPIERGPFALTLAWQGTAARGNGHLVIISHGSGGSPWVHADLARTLVANLPGGGHGALLSPFPPMLPEAAAELLNDPPGFDRGALPEVDRRIAAFFRKHLLP